MSFSPDPHGGPECLWFCFRVHFAAPNPASRVSLVLKHAENALGGEQMEHFRPVVRCDENAWVRLGAPRVHTLPDGRREAEWTIQPPERTADVALCYPYGPENVLDLLKDCPGHLTGDTIGVSQQARPLLRVSNDYGRPGGDRPGVYVVARQHSGEVPGSWVLDGFLRALAERGQQAPLVWGVPLSNIDGVMEGDYGKDNFPYDLNRAWGQPPMRHEVLVIQRDVYRWKQRCRPALGLDFHAPGGCEKGGCYFYLPKPQDYPEHHRLMGEWVEQISQAVDGQYVNPDCGQVALYPSRWETASLTQFFCEQGIPALSMETPYALVGRRVLELDDYRRIGEQLAEAVCRQLGMS